MLPCLLGLLVILLRQPAPTRAPSMVCSMAMKGNDQPIMTTLALTPHGSQVTHWLSTNVASNSHRSLLFDHYLPTAKP
eukprot:6464514-Amphidinium_carterae.1